MEETKKTQSPMAWVLGQTGDYGGQYVLSVVLAVIGVAFSLAPYFVVIGIVQGLMGGVKDFSFYLSRCLIMAAFWLGRVLFHALSTSTSHKATFAVLGEMRKRCMEKLTRMPLGTVLEQSSGALKNTLIERIDSIETTLAHIVPEFTANLLIPIIILIYIFTIDWRMGLASLATVPLGMFCYVFMMAGSAKFYQRTVTATKALNDTAVEYIGGIQVIKVFGKTKSSYERFVHDAYLSCGIGAILTLLATPGKVFTCIIVYTITQFIENQFIYPHVVGNSVGLPPILTLAAVVIGDRISGLLGMIFAIPMMAVLYTLGREGVQKALHDREIEGL